jgi:uncharacterized protein (DUF1684 family)
MLCANKRCFALLAVVTSVSYAADEAYVAEIQKWRQENDDFLCSERSPLRLVGRFQVEEGDSRLGSDPASTIVLPDRAPGQTGTLARRGGAFSFEAAKGTPVTVNGQPLTGATSVKVAKPPAPSDRISAGDFSFAIRPRGDDYYLLLQDSQSSFFGEFKGSTCFPIDAAYKVEAQFNAYPQQEKVLVPYTGGSAEVFTSSGDVVFQLMGQTFRLKAFVTGDQLFVMFRDQTSGKETYGGGRYINAEAPTNGKVILDFNKAYNPYCAFSPYAACPIPPRQNHLAVRIEAGATYLNL